MADYWQGVADAEAMADGSEAWIIGGCLFGAFGVGIAYLKEPQPPTYVLIGKSQQYVLGYSERYKEKERAKNTNYA